MYDNRSEYDDTLFLYDDTPQEMKDNWNLYYRNRHNDNCNTNYDNRNVNNDIHYFYDENHDAYDVGDISARSEVNGPNWHVDSHDMNDDSHDMNDDNRDINYDSRYSNNENHPLYYDNHEEYDDRQFFVWWYAKLCMMITVTCIITTT